MAGRSVLQEIPILVPQTEHQSYVVVSEDEEPPAYNKLSSAGRPHARYISNDEAKENITPAQFEDTLKEESQARSLDSGDAGESPGDDAAPSVSCQAGGPTLGAASPTRGAEDSPNELPPCNTPMDFSTVTVGDLGISSESFTTKCAGKSPKSLHKHRRRSTIGVRGSPEMNFLIRQIALQRSNTKSEPDPLVNLENHFTPPRNSILRQKISAFRNAFQAVEETEGKLSFPGFSEDQELESERGEEEVRLEPPEKRKKLWAPSDPELSSAPLSPSVACPPQPWERSQLQKSAPEKILESDCSLASRLSSDIPSKPVEVQSDENQIWPSPSRRRKRKVMYTSLLSPPEPEPEPAVPLIMESSPAPVLKPALKKTPVSNFVHFQTGFRAEMRSLFSLQASAAADDLNKSEDSLKKKKVTFGRELSPELFDQSLPANTPLRRGSTPYSYHKLEASPCQSPCQPMAQPDFNDEEEVETLQPLSFCFDTESSDSDSPPSSSLPEGTEEDPGPDEGEEAAAQTRSPTEEPVTSSEETAANADPGNEAFLILPDDSPARPRRTRSSDKQKVTSTQETTESNGPKAKVRLTARNTRKPVIVRKVQIKVPLGKGRKRGRKSKKSIQKAVCSERGVVSKKPLLSPIPELPEVVPTPPASTSRGLPPVGKASRKNVVKKVHAAARAGKAHFTLEEPPKRNIDESRPVKLTVNCVEDVQTQDALVDPALEDMKVSGKESPENPEDLPGSAALELVPQAASVSSECPPSTTCMEVMDHLNKQPTSGPFPSSEEKTSKTKYTKRRSSTRRCASHSSGISEWTVECVKQDDDDYSNKPEMIIDPVQGASAPSSSELPVEGTITISSKPPVTTDGKKSRRSSRNHQVSNRLSATAPAENGPVVLPYSVEYSDSSMSDFCLPIDDALQFPQQEKKVRRSMRLRRDTEVIGLSWVQENGGSETTRRKSVSSVVSSTLSLDKTAPSPNKENVSGYQVTNVAKRTRRRTLCSTTIQDSVPPGDTKRRRSNYFQKAPTTPSAEDEVVHSTLAQDA